VSPAQVARLYPGLLHRAVHDDPTQLLAMVELYLEAVRRPGVRQALGRMAVSNARASAGLHAAAGLPGSPREAGVLDAYFLGVAVSLLALPPEALAAVGMDDVHALGTDLFHAAVPTAADAAVTARRTGGVGDSGPGTGRPGGVSPTPTAPDTAGSAPRDRYGSPG
jgi:hypothetical protein